MDNRLILVTGGARSGKSTFAEKLVNVSNNKVAYIATAIAFDEGMKDRIKKHKESRPKHWNTYELYKDIYKEIKNITKDCDTILLDCITILVTNLMFDFDQVDYEKCSRNIIDEIEKYIKDQVVKLINEIRKTNVKAVFVTNELGMGIVPENRLSRIYRDIAGRINQVIAQNADDVYLLVSGVEIKIK
ncbi:bifunctional adenosylcobinamide kinase/adenosylcobinamide-phosphate guanylyltransferase [Helicovermis profundi]|uniref:Adenosylcobinamide kinase n=1 Tax=Helicovermis profundi TaxID=3065157 RepID=A0AAU9EA42_9FIRM|nr:bifunctional adenosylcobinamide kinase/adenosylcobinamide-phosphate guanylyltransferase [Clostridia bacterium S502]